MTAIFFFLKIEEKYNYNINHLSYCLFLFIKSHTYHGNTENEEEKIIKPEELFIKQKHFGAY